MKSSEQFERVEREVLRNMRELNHEQICKGPARAWRDAPPGAHPMDLGYYQPTGNRKLDLILANARPPIRYGGNESAVGGYRGDLDANGITGRGSTWIIQPSMEQFTSDAGRRATLAHELVHWTKERGRAERPVAGMTDSEREACETQGTPPPVGYAQEELTAEIGAALLLDAVGDSVNYLDRAKYAANWAVTIPRPQLAETVAHAMADAERAVAYLLQFCHEVA